MDKLMYNEHAMSDEDDNDAMDVTYDDGDGELVDASAGASPSPPPSAPLQPSSRMGSGVDSAKPNVAPVTSILQYTLSHIQSNPSICNASGPAAQSAVALLLGMGITAAAFLAAITPFAQLFTFVAIVLLFHILEYTMTAIFHPSQLTVNSFLLNHSTSYHIAMLYGAVEYCLELYLMPGWKYPTRAWPFFVGLLLCIVGQTIRTLAMLTAAQHFTHQVADFRTQQHQLVVHGIYSYVRHPSYTGWFLWSVSTQLLLCNPICMVGFTLASYQFFKSRITYEESRMLVFFGDDYRRYQENVPSGIPFVRGYMR